MEGDLVSSCLAKQTEDSLGSALPKVNIEIEIMQDMGALEVSRSVEETDSEKVAPTPPCWQPQTRSRVGQFLTFVGSIVPQVPRCF